MKRIKDSYSFAFILNLLLPGAGHVFWREYTFGLFVFLIALLAMTLFIVSFIISTTGILIAILFGLPALFFLFTFVDLGKSITRRNRISQRSVQTMILYLVGIIVFQVFSPIAPVNFVLRNPPEVFSVDGNSLSPEFKDGDLVVANPLAWRADLIFVDGHYWFDTPRRGEIVRFNNGRPSPRTGVILGMFGEEVQLVDGVLLVDGVPQLADLPGKRLLHGDMALTLTHPTSILIATLNLGVVDRTYQVPADSLIGRVCKLF